MAEGDKPARMPFYYRHLWKNFLLLFLSLACIPLSAGVVLLCLAVSKLHGNRNWTFSKEHRNHGAAVRQRKTILITGVSMTKGLAIARNLARHTPHRIIGADTSALSPGRFSSLISKFYRLDSPNGDDPEPYVDSILSIIQREKVDLWISCSSVVAAVEDGQVVRLAEKQAKTHGRTFEAIQFREDIVEKFHEKDKFIAYIESLKLPVPESHRCTSPTQALDVLMRELHSRYSHSPGKPRKKSLEISSTVGTQYLMKPIGVDDKARSNMMTLLPFPSIDATTKYIRSLNISPTNPFQLQQYIHGAEYCTHALVIRGKVKAFTSCPSSELLMHYEPLPAYSRLSQEMLRFTQRVCQAGGEAFTGHLSFDFLVQRSGNEGLEGEDVELYPIECNPRAHTAVVLFDQTPEMADAYLSVFSTSSALADSWKSTPVFPKAPANSYYWLGHDLVALVLLPLLDFVFGKASRKDAAKGVREFAHHVVYWRDGTLALDDPWPFFVLYHGFWPARFVEALWTRRAWSR